MKTVFIHLDDQDHAELIKRKGKKTWREYIMSMEGEKNDHRNDNKNIVIDNSNAKTY